jgi:hypothetical protein
LLLLLLLLPPSQLTPPLLPLLPPLPRLQPFPGTPSRTPLTSLRFPAGACCSCSAQSGGKCALR